MRFSFAALCLVIGAPALACPALPDQTQALDELFENIQKASGPSEGQALGRELWQIWTAAPDQVAQEMLNRAMRKRESYDFFGAKSDLDALVGYCPDYAEGYNQRAFVNYLSQNFEAALPDLDRALALQPRHVGVLTGRALTYFALGRTAEAQDDLVAAVALNPWISERALLENPPAAPGSDL